MNHSTPSLIVPLAMLSLGLVPPAVSGGVPPDQQRGASMDVYQLFVGSQGRAGVVADDPKSIRVGVAGGGMVIGDMPGEVLVVSGTLNIQGDLQIIGDGRVEIEPTGTLHIMGVIEILGNGVLVGIGGRIELVQTYDYESQFLVWDQGSLDLTDTVIDGDGHSFSLAAGSSVIWDAVEITHGFATWALFSGADVSLSEVTNAGEFLQLESSTLSLVRCQTSLYWVTLPDGSIIDTTLPSAGDVALFEINASTPWATGIPYTVHIEDCTDTFWAIMAQDGSSATIRDSQLRAVGSVFERADTIEITGLANGMSMTDTTFSWGGLQERFVNSTVQTWNLYAWQQTDLRVNNSIFGEIFSEDQAIVTITQSICDGSGGHIETTGQGQMFFLQSLCLTQVTVNDDSLFISASSSFISPIIDATGSSIIAFYNSTTSGDPRAHDASTIFLVAVNPLTAARGEIAPITGSARMITAPTSPLDFVSYDVEFFDGQDWMLIDGPITTPVAIGALAQWDTGSIAPGEYPIRVSLTHSGGGDPIRAQSTATINAPACPADLTGDGLLDFFDVSAFLNAFAANDPVADFTNDGQFDFFDVSAFLNAFSAGCP